MLSEKLQNSPSVSEGARPGHESAHQHKHNGCVQDQMEQFLSPQCSSRHNGTSSAFGLVRALCSRASAVPTLASESCCAANMHCAGADERTRNAPEGAGHRWSRPPAAVRRCCTRLTYLPTAMTCYALRALLGPSTSSGAASPTCSTLLVYHQVCPLQRCRRGSAGLLDPAELCILACLTDGRG